MQFSLLAKVLVVLICSMMERGNLYTHKIQGKHISLEPLVLITQFNVFTINRDSVRIGSVNGLLMIRKY